MKLSQSFYGGRSVVSIARQLLGKELCTRFDGVLTTGIISETEAYHGINDRASHAFGNRRTPRTEVMFGHGGVAYIYLCYGIHSLFNVVTGKEGVPHAVLVRSLQPAEGIDQMRARRGLQRSPNALTSGPGNLCKALGIHYSQSGISLTGNRIWIRDAGITVKSHDILVTPRIGVEYASADALRPYRFKLLNDGLNR